MRALQGSFQEQQALPLPVSLARVRHMATPTQGGASSLSPETTLGQRAKEPRSYSQTLGNAGWFTPEPKAGELSSAAAAAKSLQSCPTLCDPLDSSPPGSPIPGILQARTLEWVTIFFSNA